MKNTTPSPPKKKKKDNDSDEEDQQVTSDWDGEREAKYISANKSPIQYSSIYYKGLPLNQSKIKKVEIS